MFSGLWGSTPSPTEFPEIETVKGAQDLVTVAEKTFKEILEAEANPEWASYEYEDEGDVTLFDRTLPGTKISSIKASGTIPAAPKVLYDSVYSYDVAWAQQFDVDLVSFDTLLTSGDDIALILFRSKAPYPVTPREFVLVRARKVVQGVMYIFSASVNYAPAAYDSNFVRGVVPHNAYIIRPIEGKPNESWVTRITAIDPKGSIPSFVVNMMKTKSGDYLTRLRKVAASL